MHIWRFVLHCTKDFASGIRSGLHHAQSAGHQIAYFASKTA
jgi:hypothetical protein